MATPEQFHAIADLIAERRALYNRLAVVVSAMGNTTDDLIALAKRVHPDPPRREVDMLITVGERISISLLAMALKHKGIDAISYTGSQSGIITSQEHTDARIVDIRPHRLLGPLDAGKVLIIAGFQGVSRAGEITTLGRGGSDTTAVAVALALRAEKVEFFKDVLGIYAEDPAINPAASLLPRLSYDELLHIVRRGGHAVLHERCIQLARMNSLPLHVLSFADRRPELTGTLIWDGSETRPPPCYE